MLKFKSNMYETTQRHFAEFCLYLMGEPECTKKNWTRFRWSRGKPSAGHGSISINISEKRWVDFATSPKTVDCISRKFGLMEFVSHIRQCKTQEAIKIIRKFAEEKLRHD